MKPIHSTLASMLVLALAAGCGGGNDAESELRQYVGDERARGTPPTLSADEGGDAEASLRLGDAGIDDPYSGDVRRVPGGGGRMQSLAGGPGAESRLLRTAKRYVGTPYEYGSDREEASTFDCSDFAQWVYGEALGLSIPRDSRSQAEYVRSRGSRTYDDPRDARPGDLLFFSAYRGNARSNYDGRRNETITHVAIALGNGRVIHSLSEDTGGVRIDSLSDNHLEYRFVFGGTLIGRSKR